MCVEVKMSDGRISVRASGAPGEVLTLSVEQWRALLEMIRSDRLTH